MNLTYGSRGDEVKKLQQALNSTGSYSLTVDGSYGPKTQAAVRNYQTKNGLKVDGIAGEQTLGKLYQQPAESQPQQLAQQITTAQTATTQTQQPSFPSTGYKPSAAVESFKQQLQTAINNGPGEYKNQYKDQMDSLMAQINGREPFYYNAQEDALYQILQDQYVRQGQKAMADTVGQAAALTGGYGSTYAQRVGQQAYDEYLTGLMNQIPTLEERAYARYQQDGQKLEDQLSRLEQLEAEDYGRYRDQKTDYETEIERLTRQYETERDFDQKQHSENRGYAYDTAMSMLSAGLMPTEDMLYAAGIPQADAKAMVDAYLLQQQMAAAGGRGYGGGGLTAEEQELLRIGETPKTSSFESNLKTWQQVQATDTNAMWGNYDEYVYNEIQKAWRAKELSDNDAIYLMDKYGLLG